MRAALLIAAALAGCFHAGPPGAIPNPPHAADLEELSLRFVPVADGLHAPVAAVPAGDALLVVEQAGVVRALRPDGALAPALDIRSLVLSGGERGLLGLAVDAEGRRAYLDYTRAGDGASVLARHPLRADGTIDPAGEVLLVVEQPYANHNGGGLAFGPDGMLYFGLGDGGAGGDPHNHGQRLDSLLGKLLRLDVSGESGLRIPPDNPFVNRSEARGEIVHYGLRNPWRFGFDAQTGDLYLGDVGQNRLEEIDFVPANGARGVNFGWAVWEGSSRYAGGEAAPPLVGPVAEYEHTDGRCSVTGGYVYRGSAHPALRGIYLYGDYCTGEVWGLAGADGTWRTRVLGRLDGRISSFAQEASGEILVVDHGGRLLRVGLA